MTDLTKIIEPFGLLDKATQEALRYHWEGGVIEHYSGTAHGWQPKDVVCWYSRVVYRAKPEPVHVDRISEIYDFYTVNPMTFAGRHRITCNPDGTNPTITWEPIE